MASLSIEKKTHLRDVSFSSYLNPSKEEFLRKLVETSKIPNSMQKENVYFREKNVEDEEIGVFGAEKYFNGAIDEGIVDRHQDVKNQQLNLSPSKVKIQGRTPSVHSESSWNSQSALLQSGQKNSIHNKNDKRRQAKSLLSTLSCNCSCGDKNSVDVDVDHNGSVSKRNVRGEVDLDPTNQFRINPQIMEEMQMKKIGVLAVESKKEDGFTFPIMNSKTGNLEVKNVSQEEEDENKRKLLDVFGPPILEKRKESISLERKLDLFTIDTNPRREEIDFPKSSKGTFDDFESDASSDLFEIESFSTTNNSNSYLIRQSSKASSCVSPTTCYAPSEASIEWSVVTASAADFSFISDSEYPKSSTRAVENARKTGSYGKGKELEKRRSGILSGCKSQKAVRVAGDTYRSTEEVVSYTRGQRKSGSNPIQRIDSRNR